MCLAVPGQIIARNDFTAEVKLAGVVREISLELVPEAQVGDYVLVHAGFAIQVIDEEEAKKTLEIFKELLEHEVS
ncbi:hydrogenase assembly chaperone HypC/HupF [Thermincola ferriacetica]|uniref:Hydrogenase assembly chaperone hypC/hupF n=2 Tax=Thermincola TaxID=278993 RepID=D5XEU0_THEPJ|nr:MULTISPECIES: HypC/HybG/HupF family hydrogenase formation chaperone [Thermincola]ADG82161.1 hydrogenase assembly chaperone hypC/hupF [Thermincola potens JR]KNZ71179.1 hydrogenase assembly chaperone HypC/HupF [Thermincola ferriacetica]